MDAEFAVHGQAALNADNARAQERARSTIHPGDAVTVRPRTVVFDPQAGVPPAPPGVSVDANIARAEKLMGGLTVTNPHIVAMSELTRLFPTGHEMDYKRHGDQYRDFGNFNYGAFGTALGLSPYILHSGAGLQQMKDKRWNSEYGIPFLSGKYGDNDQDYEQIEKGIRYYHSRRKPR